MWSPMHPPTLEPHDPDQRKCRGTSLRRTHRGPGTADKHYIQNWEVGGIYGAQEKQNQQNHARCDV